MANRAKVSGIASRWNRRFRADSGRDVGEAPRVVGAADGTPSPGVRLDPRVEEYAEEFRRRVLEKWSAPEHESFRANDLNHVRRYALSLSWIPDGEGRLLDPAGGAGHFTEVLGRHRRYRVETPAYFNLEKEPAPYADETFDGVVLMEVLEHFTSDPMFALAELNRVIKPGGFLFLTTPNLASWRSIHQLIQYQSPYLYGVFIRQGDTDRHNREYTVDEVGRLADAAGFRVERLEGLAAYPAHDEVPPIPGIPPENRGDTAFCLGRKDGPVRERHPSWLYASW